MGLTSLAAGTQRSGTDRRSLPDLLVSGDASVDGGIDDAVQRHAQQVDVPVQLLVLVLADQSPDLLVLVFHHRRGVLQRAHLHLEPNRTKRTSQQFDVGVPALRCSPFSLLVSPALSAPPQTNVRSPAEDG